MTPDERRAEKIRQLIQSGRLYNDAAQDMHTYHGVPFEHALACILGAEVAHNLHGIKRCLEQTQRDVAPAENRARHTLSRLAGARHEFCVHNDSGGHHVGVGNDSGELIELLDDIVSGLTAVETDK